MRTADLAGIGREEIEEIQPAIDAALARQIHLPVLRTKSLNGTSVATCRPARFLSALGDGRPSTIGGQALLRAHGLN